MIVTIEHGMVREIRLNRPPANALTVELLLALREAIEAASGDGTGALILSGAPGRFSGGLDVPLLLNLDRAEMAKVWQSLYSLLQTIAESPIPIVAAITGHAPAGGTVLALFCDWRVMAEGDYKLGLNEVQVGIPLPPVIMAGLRRLVGPRIAEQLAVTGALIPPEEALQAGLIDELAKPERVIDRALERCHRLLNVPAVAMKVTRAEARRDLVAIFQADMNEELQRVVEAWWHPSTQSALRGLVARLKSKAGS